MLGQMLQRDEALVHPRLADFWTVVDHVAAQDPAVQRTVCGGP